jgi:hypothetical protein
MTSCFPLTRMLPRGRASRYSIMIVSATLQTPTGALLS